MGVITRRDKQRAAILQHLCFFRCGGRSGAKWGKRGLHVNRGKKGQLHVVVQERHDGKVVAAPRPLGLERAPVLGALLVLGLAWRGRQSGSQRTRLLRRAFGRHRQES